MTEINKFYNEKLEHSPYSYQEKVANVLLDGKNVILSVPTGAGKTWASIMPFLYAKENPKIHFPQKMIYSLPLRTLTNSIYQDVSALTGASIQTGEFSEDKHFESDIIFSTIDQTLSNFLSFPLALSAREANINAGALIGSYLVFDEFHLLDENLSMSTTIGMLRMLGNLSRCCIMTATLSNDFMQELKKNLPNDYEIITLDDFEEDRNKISSLLPKEDKKKVIVSEEKISAEKIAQFHIEDKSIVICNRVETAQKMYRDLVNIKESNDYPNLKNTELVCLHSRFFDKDRKEKEKKLKALFGKKSLNKNAILISTQVIEAGMDISCDVMHTEISPINSFLQRAGRCARFAEETGKIHVYDVLDVEEKVNLEFKNEEDKKELRKLNQKYLQYLPYQKDICEKTLEKLKTTPNLDGNIPQQLVEELLKAKEQSIIKTLKDSSFNDSEIRCSWENCKKNNYRETIRDIQNIEIVLIDDNSDKELIENPYAFQAIGMYKFSFIGWLNKIVKHEKSNLSSERFDNKDWLVKEIKSISDSEFIVDNDEDVKFELKEIKPIDFDERFPQQVYVNAKYFGYSPDFGFNWQYPKTFNNLSPKVEVKEQKDKDFKIQKDTFYQHNKALIGAFNELFLGEDKDKLDFTFKELPTFLEDENLKKSDFIRLIHFMIILHDYGKLNAKWQNPMQKYQAAKENSNVKDFQEVLAHTDFDKNSSEDKKLEFESNLRSRGSHAGIGAYIAQKKLEELYDNELLKTAIPYAIARHHSPLVDKYPKFNISKKNYLEIEKLLEEFDFDLELERKEECGGNLGNWFYDGHEEHLLYLFFVRILRICDQKATKNYQKYLLKS